MATMKHPGNCLSLVNTRLTNVNIIIFVRREYYFICSSASSFLFWFFVCDLIGFASVSGSVQPIAYAQWWHLTQCYIWNRQCLSNWRQVYTLRIRIVTSQVRKYYSQRLNCLATLAKYSLRSENRGVTSQFVKLKVKCRRIIDRAYFYVCFIKCSLLPV